MLKVRVQAEPSIGAVFPTTHWSVVLRAAEAGSAGAAGALETLCRSYWKPLFRYVRTRGYELCDAQDLTQEFFARFLESNAVGHVDRDRGRFRSFLLGSMKHFLANEWDRAKAIKRGGKYVFISWDAEPADALDVVAAPELTAEKLYERQWALTLLDRVFSRLREECGAAGKGELFETLRIFLSGEKAATSHAEAGERLGMSAGAVQVALHRLRRRYGELLRLEISHTVSRADEIDEEIRSLFAALRD